MSRETYRKTQPKFDLYETEIPARADPCPIKSHEVDLIIIKLEMAEREAMKRSSDMKSKKRVLK